MKVIKAKNITKKNFSKFGQLIDTTKKNPISINDGYAQRFDDLINIDTCLLYTSPSPRDRTRSRMPSSA